MPTFQTLAVKPVALSFYPMAHAVHLFNGLLTSYLALPESTLAAETLALVSCCDSAIYLKKLVEAALGRPEGSTPIECIVDNKSLHESIHSVNPTSEQRLRVDIAALREMVIKKEITVIWKEKHHQLADCLTKKGASTQLLTETLQTGFLSTSQ